MTMGDFRSFLTKSNALALAIGVIIGVALGALVTTLVNAIIMPPSAGLRGHRLRVDQDVSGRTRRARRSPSAGVSSSTR